MERILYFDCFSGISGDMSIGALVDLGLDPSDIVKEIQKLGVKGYEIEIKKTSRHAISGTDVKVTLAGEGPGAHDHHHDDHDHHSHEDHGHHHHGDEERNLAEISRIIRESTISDRAKNLSIAIFTEIARAEAAVHGKKVEEVHFHEVGAIDSIVDIVGAAICIDMLKVDRIFCSPIHEGQGFIHCRHGRLPVPVPAVVKMLEGSGITVVTEEIQAELVTPTGLGILKTVAEGCGKIPEMRVERVGYGFGKTDTGSLNALRVILGTTGSLEEAQTENTAASADPGGRAVLSGEKIRDRVSLLSTNLDDSTGETLGYVMERLMESGALDVYFTPIQMKKNRPAVMLSALCRTKDTERLSDIILMETSTIGIRIQELERITLKREISAVSTELGEVRVKSVSVGGLERVQPEYEDCAKLARENNRSLQEVYEIVKRCHYGKEFSEDL